MYTLLSSMSIGYNDILNKKGKKKFYYYASSVSSLLGWSGFHNMTTVGVLLASGFPENSSVLNGT